MRRLTCCVIVAVMSISGSAQAACWTPLALDAAATRELDTMLMVSALKCRYERPELLARYNVIVRHNRPALVAANQRLRAHFENAVGKRAAEGAYDSYVTRVANRYGAAAGAFDCAAVLNVADAALAEPAAHDSLSRLAVRAAVVPDVQTMACVARPVVVAAVQRPAAPTALPTKLPTTLIVVPKVVPSQVNAFFAYAKLGRQTASAPLAASAIGTEKPPSMTLGYNFDLR